MTWTNRIEQRVVCNIRMQFLTFVISKHFIDKNLVLKCINLVIYVLYF